MPTTPGCSQRVAEQRDPVDGDRDQPGQRRVLVDRDQRFGRRVGGESRRPSQADDHRHRHQRERDDAGRARRQPPAVVEGVARSCRRSARGTRSRTAGSGAEAPARPPPSSWTSDAAVRRRAPRARPLGPGRAARPSPAPRPRAPSGASAVTRDEAGPGRLAGGRVEQVVGEARRPAPRQMRRSRPDVATAPSRRAASSVSP